MISHLRNSCFWHEKDNVGHRTLLANFDHEQACCVSGSQQTSASWSFFSNSFWNSVKSKCFPVGSAAIFKAKNWHTGCDWLRLDTWDCVLEKNRHTGCDWLRLVDLFQARGIAYSYTTHTHKPTQLHVLVGLLCWEGRHYVHFLQKNACPCWPTLLKGRLYVHFFAKEMHVLVGLPCWEGRH